MKIRMRFKVVIIIALIALLAFLGIRGGSSFGDLLIVAISLLFVWGLIKFALMFSKPFIEGFKQAEEEERKQFIQELAEEIQKSSAPSE